MTNEQALTFLSEAGHRATSERLNERRHRVQFTHRGVRLSVLTREDDDVFALECCYALARRVTDELATYRTLASLQAAHNVVKLSFDTSDGSVTADVEQFMPYGADPLASDAFALLFWRGVDLVTRIAATAAREVDRIDVSGEARRAIAKLEDGLFPRDTNHPGGD